MKVEMFDIYSVWVIAVVSSDFADFFAPFNGWRSLC